MYQTTPQNKNQISFLHFALLSALMLLFLGGCGKTNIASIDSSLNCATQHGFNASYNKTWKAVAAAVVGRVSVDIIDKDSGIISSSLSTVDGQELSMIDTTFFGQTYKYSYEVVVSSVSGGHTLVKVHVRLVNNQFWMIMNREQKIESVESYLRQKLYEDICVNLFSGSSRSCIKTLPCSNRSYRSTPKPAPSPNPGDSRYDPVVQSVQTALIKAGYNPGPADGVMGRKTGDALKQYQRANGLRVTGRVDGKTRKTLLASTTSTSPGTTPKPKPKSKPGTELVKQYLVIDKTELKVSKDPFSVTIAIIPKDGFVTFISTAGDWSKVGYHGKTGYVFSEFLGTTTVRRSKIKPGKAVTVVLEPLPEVAVQVKKKPVEKNVTLPKTARKSAEKVIVEPEKTVQPKEENVAPLAPVAPVLKYGVVAETTDIMSKASSFASPIGKVKKGSKITILATEKDFLKIRAGDNDGYVYADFVDIEGSD